MRRKRVQKLAAAMGPQNGATGKTLFTPIQLQVVTVSICHYSNSVLLVHN